MTLKSTAARPMFDRRLLALRTQLADAGLDALLVTNVINVAYLSGLRASAAALVVTPDDATLVTDFRYQEAARLRLGAGDAPSGVHLEIVDQTYDQTIVEVIRRGGLQAIGVESAHLTIKRFHWLQKELGGGSVLEPMDRQVERLRLVKDEAEILTMREAARRLSAVAREVWSAVAPGRTEREVAADIDAALLRGGFDRPAFETIVASGPNSALPHARPTPRRLHSGEAVLLDFGGVYDGYCVDSDAHGCLRPGASGSPAAARGGSGFAGSGHRGHPAGNHRIGGRHRGARGACGPWVRPRRLRPRHGPRPGARSARGTAHRSAWIGRADRRPARSGNDPHRRAGRVRARPRRCSNRRRRAGDSRRGRSPDQRAASLARYRRRFMNLDDVKQILHLMREHELTEFELERDGIKIRVCKNGGASQSAVPAVHHAPIVTPAPPAAGPALPAAPAEATEESEEQEFAVVKSPIVGTFYRSSEPGAPSFVEVGTIVKKGQVLCIIEAMKLMNEIESDHDGEIASIYVENGKPVQYGERLFAIRSTGGRTS